MRLRSLKNNGFFFFYLLPVSSLWSPNLPRYLCTCLIVCLSICVPVCLSVRPSELEEQVTYLAIYSCTVLHTLKACTLDGIVIVSRANREQPRSPNVFIGAVSISVTPDWRQTQRHQDKWQREMRKATGLCANFHDEPRWWIEIRVNNASSRSGSRFWDLLVLPVLQQEMGEVCSAYKQRMRMGKSSHDFKFQSALRDQLPMAAAIIQQSESKRQGLVLLCSLNLSRDTVSRRLCAQR